MDIIASSSLYLGILIVLIIILSQAIKIVNEYERGVVFRLGRVVGAKGPGIIILIPIVDRMVKVSLRTINMDVPAQEVITSDTVPIKVNAVIYFRVVDPVKAIISVENYITATSQIAQTTLRSVLGERDLDTFLSQREKINQTLQQIVDEQTDPWGIKVSTVETKDVELPENMRRAMAKQAEAERERRAKVIHAEGEFQASEKLVQAAEKMSSQPLALQLRYLQTLGIIAADKNTTTVFPFPMEFIKPFLDIYNKQQKTTPTNKEKSK
ncbi:MAG: slipin family protein [Atribacterota bacterium]|jgi:regulator of protease activity HflC (stomatin/prohibitin superfamily)|nr:slipin family protein [Atribacterota bacterium]MDD3640887.1 slipin family protein [Atribacterota bacterium]MDI9597729.1 slipin family protein [Atribacterota bacterium]